MRDRHSTLPDLTGESRSSSARDWRTWTPLLGRSNAIQIFAHLVGEGGLGTKAEHWLSEDERLRADKFARQSDRRSFVASRGLLRGALGHRLGVRPETIVFAVSSYGKPDMAHPTAGGTTFNLSHTDGLVALAVGSGNRRVGIDIERRGREMRGPRLTNYLHKHEADYLAATPLDRRDDEFLRIWTRKEAVHKADGRGLSLPLDTFDVLAERHRIWTISDLDVSDKYVGAVAYEGRSSVLPLEICWID